MAHPDHERPTSPQRAHHALCRTGTCAYGWSRWACARRTARVAAEADQGQTVIETPCWVEGAATTADLDLVHAWNEMMQLRADAAEDDVTTAAAVATHLAALCRRLCPRR